VVFILLLFFVVTTTFTRETQLRVDLPEAVSGSPAEDQSSSNWTSRSAPKACFGEQPDSAEKRPGDPDGSHAERSQR
jgi:biopolymer transport protein ExbD